MKMLVFLRESQIQEASHLILYEIKELPTVKECSND